MKIVTPEVIVAPGSGFCFGVKRAINIAEKALNTSRKKVYSLGPIIHNPQVVKRLSDKGLKIVGSLRNIKSGKVLIRSHGIAKELKQELESRGFDIEDATCPLVKKAQNTARKLRELGYKVVIIGEKSHPEVISLLSYSGKDAIIIESPSAIGRICSVMKGSKVGIISQTTVTMERFKLISSAIKNRLKETEIFDTVCREAERRQNSARDLAGIVDLMIVVGGRNSANTTKLFETCNRIVPAYHIETEKEIKRSWLVDKSRIGITAGASTPDWMIKKIISKINELGAGYDRRRDPR